LQTRDFIHVSDVARAVLAAADADIPTGAVCSLNVGYGSRDIAALAWLILFGNSRALTSQYGLCRGLAVT
jgi:nucleoside-diphosphate-sugar epimerase